MGRVQIEIIQQILRRVACSCHMCHHFAFIDLCNTEARRQFISPPHIPFTLK